MYNNITSLGIGIRTNRKVNRQWLCFSTTNNENDIGRRLYSLNHLKWQAGVCMHYKLPHYNGFKRWWQKLNECILAYKFISEQCPTLVSTLQQLTTDGVICITQCHNWAKIRYSYRQVYSNNKFICFLRMVRGYIKLCPSHMNFF